MSAATATRAGNRVPLRRMLAQRALLFAFAFFAPPILAKDAAPVWLSSACYQLRLSTSEKLGIKPSYKAKFLVKTEDGHEIHLSERQTEGLDSNSIEVAFPDDFRNQRTNLRSSADCFNGKRYAWEIYVDDKIIDSGTIEFKRTQRSGR